MVLLGTLYPIIANAFKLGQVSVGSPYFNALFVPLTWLILVVMGVGAMIRYKSDSRPFVKLLSVCAVLSLIIGAGVGYLITRLGNENFDMSIYITAILSAWVMVLMVYDIKDKIRHAKGSPLTKFIKLSPSYHGMNIAHLGVLITALGVAGVSSLSIEKDVAMTVGDTTKVQEYEFYLQEFSTITGSNYDATQATINVKKDDKFITTLYPQKRNYVVSMMPMTEVGLYPSLFNEVYVALGEPIAKEGISDAWAVRVHIKPMVRWLWLGAIVMSLGGLIAVLDKRYRLKDKQTTRAGD